MSRIEQRLKALGLALPQPLQLPAGVSLPFPWVRIVGTRALFSGHGPTHADGSLAELPFNIPVEIEGEVELAERLPAKSAA